MSLLTKVTDLLYRRQKTIELLAIFLFFTLIAFRFDSKNLKLI